MTSDHVYSPANPEVVMDFTILSKFDDFLVDTFIDNLFLWFTTIKMNSGPREASLVPCEDVLDILRKDVTDAQNVSTASKKFVALEPVKKFMAAYSTAQQHKFEKYVRRYLSMYLPTAGYEICDTDRYGGNSQARLVATKDWDVGDEIRCCTGYIAYLDSEDDAQLRNQGRDFSVMYSYRKKKNCLFLGPARFANHDCDANCKFINVGNNGICFKVIKRVARGEELTVFYSNEYFGKDNCECRCVTCERKMEGFFTSQILVETNNNCIAQKNGLTRRSSRKRKKTTYKKFYPPGQRASEKTSSPESVTQQYLNALFDSDNEMADIHSDTGKYVSDVPQPVRRWQRKKHRNVMHITFQCNETIETSNARDYSLPHREKFVGSALNFLCNVALHSDRRLPRSRIRTLDGPRPNHVDARFSAQRCFIPHMLTSPNMDHSQISPHLPQITRPTYTSLHEQSAYQVSSNTQSPAVAQNSYTHCDLPGIIRPRAPLPTGSQTSTPSKISPWISTGAHVSNLSTSSPLPANASPQNQYVTSMGQVCDTRSPPLYHDKSDKNSGLSAPAKVLNTKHIGVSKSYQHTELSDQRSGTLLSRTFSSTMSPKSSSGSGSDLLRQQHLYSCKPPPYAVYPAQPWGVQTSMQETNIRPHKGSPQTTPPAFDPSSPALSHSRGKPKDTSQVVSSLYRDFGLSHRPVVTHIPIDTLPAERNFSLTGTDHQSFYRECSTSIPSGTRPKPCVRRRKLQCMTCNEHFTDNDDENDHLIRCERCKRHYLIFNMEWPIRKLNRKRGRRKQEN